MNMAVCRIALRLPENHSLKGKRHVLQSIISRVRNRFNVSIAEVGDQEQWQIAALGFCCVSNDSRHANQVVSQVIHFIEEEVRGDAEVLDFQTETLSGLP